MKSRWEKMAEAFMIFAKYGDGDTSAGHDVIFSGPSPSEVSEEDKARLEELGWWTCEYNCWKKNV